MAGLLSFLKRRRFKLPCEQTGDCPYEYDKDPDRDIEGMPFIDGDPRSCPPYGHICPEFMEDLGLTVEDLGIRATIHCGAVAEGMIEKGKWQRDEAIDKLLQRFRQTTEQYPPDQYPQYY